MSFKIIEVVTDTGHIDTIVSIAGQHNVLDYWYTTENEEGVCSIRLLVQPENRQTVVDAIQSVLGGSEKSRIIIQPVEAVWPLPKEEEVPEQKSSTQTTREELYGQIERGARLDSNFLLLVFLSTVVVSIGLIEDNIAVVIGAMVIAPLLGPNIAFALAAALGDKVLIWRALSTNVVGVVFAFMLAFVIGYFWNEPVFSNEIKARTVVGLDGVGLALASGAAAALSLTTGLSSVLVGVMVAVALLPPTATAGLMLGSGQYSEALGAALLLAVNIVCVNLSAKLVFLIKGVRPRTWLEKQKARQSMSLYMAVWIISLLILLAVILLRHNVQIP